MSREASLGRRHQYLSPPPPQYDPYAPQLGYLSESVHRLLTERECAIFDRGLADYHRRRNVKAFVECLSLVLNSNQKRQLLLPIRDTYVKPSDISKFNQLVQTYGLAASLKRRKKEEEKEKESEGVHKLEVKRDADGEWGFDIRGGSEHGLGIFVSWVEPGSSALKNGLQIGDQILKVNETNFESISHYEAVQLMKNCKKLRLWVLSHGRVPGSRMAHKAYRWIDTAGRPTTPPPDPFDIMEQRAKGGYKVLSEADERKLTLMVDSGRELGISIRGGAEHGLGIYISSVEGGSVGEVHGLKRGDQILDVNGVNFINIVHADAAKALSAQPCMVMKVKDVGKLPHSRITTYGQTQWYQSPSATMNRAGQNQPDGSPVFTRGAGTQIMLKKQDGSFPGRGMMNEIAQSVLEPQEMSTLSYYIEQYEQQGMPVEDLVTPLMDLLNTPEKLQVLSEVRSVIRARDLNRFNELTVHREIAAKKAFKKAGSQERLSPHKGLQSQEQQEARDILTNFAMQPRSGTQTMAQVHPEGAVAARPQLSPPTSANLSMGSGEQILTPGAVANGSGDSSPEGGGRDRVPQKLSPQHRKTGTPVFHAPPPPSSPPQVSTSTPNGAHSPDPQTVLTNTLKERRQWMRPGARERSADETWDGQWTDASLSSIQSPPGLSQRHGGLEEMDGPTLTQVEERVRQETEAKLRREFEEKERRAAEGERRRREEEEQRKEQMLRAEREAMEKRLRDMEERTKQELEAKIRREAEEDLQRRLEEKERELEEERERREAEEQQRRRQEERETLQKHKRQVEERTKQELEEKIWKEAEVHIRQELEERMQEDRDRLMQQAAQAKEELNEQSIKEMEDRIRREAEEKYRVEYEQKMLKERQKLKKQEEAARRRQEEEESAKREAEIARMEAEEQAKIELEERIRREAEAKAKEEYEAKLQRETEHRARLAKEIEVQKAAGERRQQDRRERERETPRRRGAGRERQVESRAREQNVQPRKSEPPEEIEPLQERDPQEESQEQVYLAAQRRRREEEELRQQQQEEEERQAQEEERKRKEDEKKRKQELARKREENIHRREEEKKQKEAEQKKTREKAQRRKEEETLQAEQEEQQQLQQEHEEEERQRELERENRRREAEQRQDREAERRAGFNVKKVKVKFGEEENGGKKKQKSREQIIEEERQKAEERLKRRLEREKAKQAQKEANPDDEIAEEKANAGPVGVVLREGKSFAGYSNLKGQIFRIKITKVCKKLGIAIDGGANTKQKAVIIREISPGGCAAQTGEGLSIGQQILQVSGTNLAGLKHKDVVLTIKNAFEGPLNKTLELVVLDRDDPEE